MTERKRIVADKMKDTDNDIIVRNAKPSDVHTLAKSYILLTKEERRLFHPFPFSTAVLHLIFFYIILSQRFVHLTKLFCPQMVFLILVAEDNRSSRLLGFAYLRIKEKSGGIVANRGIISLASFRSRGVGTIIDTKLITNARKIGIQKFRVTVLKDNASSISFHHKMGYREVGESVEYWGGAKESVKVFERDL